MVLGLFIQVKSQLSSLLSRFSTSEYLFIFDAVKKTSFSYYFQDREKEALTFCPFTEIKLQSFLAIRVVICIDERTPKQPLTMYHRFLDPWLVLGLVPG